jgi:cation transporter-like permease
MGFVGTRSPSRLASGIFSFPSPVNEVSARLVAAVVCPLALATVALHVRWLVPVLAYGFLARALTGPTLSPLGQLVTRVLTPRLGLQRPVPGPPKRFAQAIGATLSLTAVVLMFAAGADTAAYALVGAIALAAALESMLGLCVGCRLFALLMRAGVVPDEVCLECANIARRA